MTPSFSERKTVQDPILKYAKEIGWNEISQKDSLTFRIGEEGLFFYDILSEKLKSLNPGVVNDGNVNEIIKRIENVR